MVVESGMGLRNLLDVVRSTLRLGPRRGAVVPVPPHQLPDVASVVDALRQLQEELEPGDGVRQFNRMYLQVTELVGSRLSAGYFADPELMERLDVVFAQLYLDAVASDRQGRSLPQCWEPLFERRSVPLAPVQFAVAGMNAHINHDLPVAVVTACEQLGRDPRSRRVREDYDRVNALLAQVHEEVRRSFVRSLPEVEAELSPLLTLVGSWSITRARDAAWVNAEVLRTLKEVPELREEFRVNLCRTVGMASRTLLVLVAEPV
ncbi:DUF5995 family protein [Ornithinimicrobium tianjinense]|uniref:Uncharacterized protein n=1 Tax=Ornithinimicrobium tianjinense TaxID=1195761 RepID=A0A917BVV8_9MICO|nr:DUF5995 family protein [Ornithinimicrobium tianjinense]GGF56646.1 hypothetical protein GCM10011366_25640 [Ornithinimicrobium tianjinense]